MARLSPFVSRHLVVRSAYSFLLADLAPARSATCVTPTRPMTTRTRPNTAR